MCPNRFATNDPVLEEPASRRRELAL